LGACDIVNDQQILDKIKNPAVAARLFSEIPMSYTAV
jgi:hypothetical protein